MPHAATPARPRAPAPAPAATAPAAPDRKQAILLAAERLFAERGYHAVSIRDIAAAAGVPLALVGYHYGPKQALFEAIFEHWGGSVQERLARLEQALAAGPADLLPRIVQAFVRPVLALRASPDGEFYALMVARELAREGPETDTVLRRIFDPLAHAFIDAMQRVWPRAGRDDLAWGYQFALGALLHHLHDRRVVRLSRQTARLGDPIAGARLESFIEGGLVAVLGPVPGAAKAPSRPRSKTTTRRRQAP